MASNIEKDINFDEIIIYFKDGGSTIKLTVNEINGNVGNGDMLKAVYDTDRDGIVDNADKLDGQEGTYYLDYNNFTNTPTIVTEFVSLNDTPNSFTGNANKTLAVNSTEDGVVFVDNLTTDEHVKINSSDTPGYLAEKIDGSTIIADTVNYKIKVKDDLYALKSDFDNHTADTTIHYTQSSISITHSQISDWSSQFTTDFDTAFSNKSTDDLSEGSTNLYYTDARVSANSDVSANTSHRSNTSNPHNVTKDQVGLGNVDNVKQIPFSDKGSANGVATLDSNGLVPSSQLPSYVDDVLEYNTKNDFPATGESGKIYVAKDTNLTYRWGGSDYVEISPSLALGTTHSTAFYGDWGNEAYQHSQITSGNPHNVTSEEVDTNTNNFDNILSSNEDTIQKALDKLDDHVHDDRYYTESETDTLLNGKSDVGHTHDDRYYTESEVDTLLDDKEDKSNKVTSFQATPDDNHYPSEKLVKDNLDNKSDINHTHDDRYYTETETDNLLNNKADKVSSGTENNFVSLDANGNIKDSGNKSSDFALASHTHTWTDVSKSGSKLSDIEDVPGYSSNANKVLAIKSDESGVEWVAQSGGSGNVTKYVSNDVIPSSSPYEVTITHNLNDNSPFVQVYYDNHLIEPYDVEIVDANNVKITVDSTLAGETIKTVIIGDV